MNVNILGCFRKMIVFGFYEILDIFWGSSQNWTILGDHSLRFRAFSQAQGTELEYFWGLCLIVLIFLVNSICCISLRIKKN